MFTFPKKMFTRVNILKIISWSGNVYISAKMFTRVNIFSQKSSFEKCLQIQKKYLHSSIFLRKKFEMKKCLHFSKNVYKCKHFSRNVNIWKAGFKAILAGAKNVYTREKIFTRVNILSNLKSRWKMFTMFTVSPPPTRESYVSTEHVYSLNTHKMTSINVYIGLFCRIGVDKITV